MKNDSLTYEVGSERLLRLLNADLPADVVPEIAMNERRGQCLREMLESTLPLKRWMMQELPASFVEHCEAMNVLAGRPIGTMLHDGQSADALIEQLKVYAKDCCETAKTRGELDAAIVIYYAAIAHALVHRQARITRFSFGSLKDAFSVLLNKSWLTVEIRELLQTAEDLCRKQQQSG